MDMKKRKSPRVYNIDFASADRGDKDYIIKPPRKPKKMDDGIYAVRIPGKGEHKK